MSVWKTFVIGGKWWHEFENKLVEWEAFIDPVWIECTQVKDKFLLEILAAFCVPVV